MTTIQPVFRLFTLNGEPTDWESVMVANALWYYERAKKRQRSLRADKQVARGITITPRGRAYLASMKAGNGR